MITQAQLIEEARRWLGVPYVHQGRTQYGVDCIGFILCVRNAISPWWAVNARELRTYQRRPKDGLLLGIVEQHCLQLAAPEPGAMILIRWPQTPYPSHVAMYVEGNLIHAYQRAHCVVETGFRAHWRRYTHSYWRLPGVQA